MNAGRTGAVDGLLDAGSAQRAYDLLRPHLGPPDGTG